MKYRTIVADPPWEYGAYASMPGAAGTVRQSIRKPLPYEQLSIAEIKALPVGQLAMPDAHLWLWTTNRYLPAAFEVASGWGFAFRQIVVWHKTGSPSPFGGAIAPNHAEFILFCARGSLPMSARLKGNVIQAAKPYAHSRKPEHFLDLIEHVSPPPYVELFARRHRLGWDVWGNESANTATLEAPA